MKFFLSTSLAVAATLAAGAAQAQTTYTNAADFAAATTGVTNTDFEGQAAGTSTWILQNGPWTTGGITISQASPGSPFQNAFRSDPGFTSYYYDWGTGDVVNTPYAGTLTVTFAAPVTAFSVDLGVFYDDNNFNTPPGAPSTLYGMPITLGTAQGNFTVNTATTQVLTFFGITSNTAFTSFTISGISPIAGVSMVLDNVRYGTANVTAVPEPMSWALMLGGFGLAGAGLRRRQARTMVSFA
jgi:hypothetical protein